MSKQVIIDVSTDHAIIGRYAGGMNISYKRVTTAIKNAAKHVAQYPDSYDAKAPIVITPEAAALLAQE